MFKALFLGTGAAEGCPREGHTDRQCAAARMPGSRTARRRSSLLIETGLSTILVDAGPDVLLQLADAKVKKIDAVLLTHAHSDAAGGLNLLGAWLSERGMAWVPLYYPAGADKRIASKMLDSFDLIPLPNGKDISVGKTKILAFPVRHGMNYDEPTFGYRIGGLVYASDMEGAPESSLPKMEDAEALVIDGTFWEERSVPGHFTVDAALDFCRTLGPKSVYFTQIGHRYPPHEEAQKLLDERTAGMDLPFPVTIAYDGLEIGV